MMSMILVNNPGDWSTAYAPLLHAEWNGCTFTDLIFPFFLFMVGVAMPYSFAKRLGEGRERKSLITQVLRRSLIIFALGFLLNLLPRFDFATVRVPGVLQRIALCYFFASCIVIGLPEYGRRWAALGLCAVYWIGMKWIPVPGYGAGLFEPVGNLCWWIDNHLLFGRTYRWAPAEGFDPEGVFSTLPSIVTTLLGYFTGTWLRSERGAKSKLKGLFVGGVACYLASYVPSFWMPVNKNLWTVPYMLLTGGFALHFLGTFYFVIDMLGYRRFLPPMLGVGSNAIFIYVGSSACAGLLSYIRIGEGEAAISIKSLIVQNLFAPWLSPINASLAYGLTYVLLWTCVAYVLYRKRIIIKV